MPYKETAKRIFGPNNEGQTLVVFYEYGNGDDNQDQLALTFTFPSGRVTEPVYMRKSEALALCEEIHMHYFVTPEPEEENEIQNPPNPPLCSLDPDLLDALGL